MILGNKNGNSGLDNIFEGGDKWQHCKVRLCEGGNASHHGKAELNLYGAFNELLSTLGTVPIWDNLRVTRNHMTQTISLVQFIEFTKKITLEGQIAGAKIKHLKAEHLKCHENINQPIITRLLLGVRLNNQVIKFNGDLNELLSTLSTVPNQWNLRVARTLR